MTSMSLYLMSFRKPVLFGYLAMKDRLNSNSLTSGKTKSPKNGLKLTKVPFLIRIKPKPTNSKRLQPCVTHRPCVKHRPCVTHRPCKSNQNSMQSRTSRTMKTSQPIFPLETKKKKLFNPNHPHSWTLCNKPHCLPITSSKGKATLKPYLKV